MNKRIQYALLSLLDISKQPKNEPVRLLDISNRQSIPLNYLEQIFNILKKHNLVKSVRGPGGGYMLGKAPSELYVVQILECLEEPAEVLETSDTKEQDSLAKYRNKLDNVYKKALKTSLKTLSRY